MTRQTRGTTATAARPETRRRPSTRSAPARSEMRTRDRDGAGTVKARRFDADRTDRELTFDEALSTKPSQRQLLWIDIGGDLSTEEAAALSAAFDLDDRTIRELQALGERPLLRVRAASLHVRVAAEPDAKERASTTWLEVITGKNLVITSHRAPIAFLEDLDDRIEDDTSFGQLDATTFVASLLDSVVTNYFNAVDTIEDDVDALDAKSLTDDGRRELLADLVAVRRRIARLRRELADHRDVFASLGAADLAQVVEDADAVSAFKAVASRFEGAIGAVEESRDVLLGSFDIYMTRTAQRTNDTMKVLALATVLLLPGSLVAGLLGMNVTVPLSKDDPLSFWIVVAGVMVFVVFLLGVARVRRWL